MDCANCEKCKKLPELEDMLRNRWYTPEFIDYLELLPERETDVGDVDVEKAFLYLAWVYLRRFLKDLKDCCAYTGIDALYILSVILEPQYPSLFPILSELWETVRLCHLCARYQIKSLNLP